MMTMMIKKLSDLLIGWPWWWFHDDDDDNDDEKVFFSLDDHDGDYYYDDDDDDDDDDNDDDDDGFPANPHHDKIPPWGEFVIDGHGGILSSAYSHHW